jgi:iron(III) transport system ATP-binding protein
MGEAMLFPAESLAGGQVKLGLLRLTPKKPVAAGKVKVAVRPEARHIDPPSTGRRTGMAAKLAKSACLSTCSVSVVAAS